MDKGSEKKGIFYATFAYLLWGVLPIYWHQIEQVPAEQILAHRVIWSCVFMFFVLLFTGKIQLFFAQTKELLQKPKQFFSLVVAAFLVTGNWGIYIWAVNHNHLVETSLGYYINPLVSILLGIVFLKERLTKPQIVSVLLAVVGVLIMTINYGQFPFVALFLAVTFGVYGLVKKLLVLDASISLALETLVVSPVALIYLLFFANIQGFGETGFDTTLLLLAGVVTAIPLLYFGKGARLIPLSLMGFLQYIAPTCMLLLGVFAYHEHFDAVDLFAFSFIWLALALFSLSKTKLFVPKKESKLNRYAS